MRDPRSTSPGSVMPTYPWLHENTIDPADVRASVVALRKVGTPYPDAEVETIPDSLLAQGTRISQSLASTGLETSWDREIVALIAYLQRLGQDGNRHLGEQRTGAADAGLTGAVAAAGADAPDETGGGR
jgi:cytochrome c oxidase cbb3-type subunit I/II